MARVDFTYSYGDRKRSGETLPVEKRPIILKECAKCHVLVDRETLFAGVCPRCPPPKVVNTQLYSVEDMIAALASAPICEEPIGDDD